MKRKDRHVDQMYLSRMTAPEVVNVTTFGAASDDNKFVNFLKFLCYFIILP